MYSTNSVIYIYVICCPRGPIHWEKNVPEVLSIWLRVIVRTKGPVFPNEDQPRLANPIFNSLYRIVGKGSKMSKILIKIIKPAFAMMVSLSESIIILFDSVYIPVITFHIV